MLYIEVPSMEFFDEANSSFIEVEGEALMFEHSLVSLSKWESLFNKPFLDSKQKTRDETLAYVKAMTISPVRNPMIYKALTSENLKEINDYIDSKMTATTFKEAPGTKASASGSYITAEIIYYWMITLQVPIEAQYWHLDRLIAQIKVINEKNAPPKKMSRREAMSQQAQMNAERKAKLNTTG